LLWGNSYLINDSISLVIPIYKIEYTNGFNPENNGVKPDVEIELNRKDLLKGKDTQLEMAIKLLSIRN
jgi:C-terminal processing protease CtpA/Prc